MKCLIYNVNNFCGTTSTLKSGGVVTPDIARAVVEYIRGGAFELVALQEFPVNHPVGIDVMQQLDMMGFQAYHNNDIVKFNSRGTSISIMFVRKEGHYIRRDVFEENLRYVCLNVNGISLLNVHASLNAGSFTLHTIQAYARTHVGFIFGDFNAGLYLKSKSPMLYAAYKDILDNGFTDLCTIDGREQITNTVTNTPIDHVLDKGVSFKSCVVDTQFCGGSDHLPIVLDY